MIAIISGTNRPESRTSLVADKVFELIGKFTDEEVNIIHLKDINPDFVHQGMYTSDGIHPELKYAQEQYLIPADKWIVLSPEYNGSFGGMLKLFIDAISVHRYAETFKGKKLGLIGVASGRAGNLRGMDHLTTAMSYLGMSVFPNRLPLPQIETKINDNALDESTVDLLNSYLEQFVKF